MDAKQCPTCGRKMPRELQGDERARMPARRSSKMLRRDQERADVLGLVPTRVAIRMGRRYTPAA
jgi:hypothetical protein